MTNKYLKKQISDFQKWGWNGVSTKIKNRLIAPKTKFKINKTLEQSRKYQRKSILIINGAAKTVSEIHRVKHLEDKLSLLKIPFVSINDNLLNKFLPENIYNFDLFYIHRCQYKNKLIELLDNLRKENKTIIYDIDDLIFDQDQIKKISFLKTMDSVFKKNFIKNTKSHLKIMKKCNLTITPTNFLSKYINDKYHIKTEVLRNHLDQKSLDNGKKIFIKNENKINKTVTIGYFPGTKTHQKDLEIINENIQELLQKYPHLKLKIVGDPSLATFFSKTKKQIIVHQKVPYKKLMKLYDGVDIHLAPLEINNDFCEGKSELKYFFAGACGIPTIASATDAFRYAIKNGVNGYLCYKNDDWKKYLEELINNPKKRLSIGKKAFKHVHQEYTPKYQSQELAKILKKIKFL